MLFSPGRICPDWRPPGRDVESFMTNACFVDTNVMLYLKDPQDPEKQAIAQRWIAALAERDLLVISPQVMNEVAHSILRKFPAVTRDDLTNFLSAMQPWCRNMPPISCTS